MIVNHWVVMNNARITRDDVALAPGGTPPDELYGLRGFHYPRFHKMDALCKWAWLAAECLLQQEHDSAIYGGKQNIAIALTTTHGCLDVDKRYYEGITMPSPALFVYTLPNIMAGEICIRHGFKGEQLCMVTDGPDFDGLFFSTHDFLYNRGMDAVLCGWTDAVAGAYSACMFWITKTAPGVRCSPAILEGLANKP